MNILKYSFVLRQVSNNQIILYSSFLESKIPMNLHLSTQALSSGMKPSPEYFNQLSFREKDKYQIFYYFTIESTQIDSVQPQIRKLWLSGYTGNIFINDPFFIFLFLSIIFILIVVSVILFIKLKFYGLLEYEINFSPLFRIAFFLLSQIPKLLDASLLNILITNYVQSQ